MADIRHIYSCSIVNVVDGDTIDVVIDLGFSISVKQRLRLAGIDTPEMNSSDLEIRSSAKKAKDFLSTLLGKKVIIETSKSDKYGRYLAEIYVGSDNESINQKLIQEGLAVPYNGGKK